MKRPYLLGLVLELPVHVVDALLLRGQGRPQVLHGQRQRVVVGLQRHGLLHRNPLLAPRKEVHLSRSGSLKCGMYRVVRLDLAQDIQVFCILFVGTNSKNNYQTTYITQHFNFRCQIKLGHLYTEFPIPSFIEIFGISFGEFPRIVGYKLCISDILPPFQRGKFGLLNLTHVVLH